MATVDHMSTGVVNTGEQDLYEGGLRGRCAYASTDLNAEEGKCMIAHPNGTWQVKHNSTVEKLRNRLCLRFFRKRRTGVGGCHSVCSSFITLDLLKRKQFSSHGRTGRTMVKKKNRALI